MFSEQLLKVLGAASIKVPNQILSPGTDGFYVSFNSVDTKIYGGVTTALVLGQMEQFLILNGDHREAYAAIVNQGVDACIAYFKQHVALKNKHSDDAPSPLLH